MGKVIEFKRKVENQEWISDISLFQTESQFNAVINAASIEMGLSDGDMLRKIADCMEVIAFMARQEAEEYEESDKGSALAVVTIFSDGTVHSRVDDKKVVTKEQVEWLSNSVMMASKDIGLSE